MAKSDKSKNTRNGYKRVEAKDAPFWSPWDPESDHPKELEGAFMGLRTLPARGKFKEQQVIDLETSDGPYTVALKGNLTRKVRSAQLSPGQMIVVEWLKKDPPSKKLPMGAHDFDLFVAE